MFLNVRWTTAALVASCLILSAGCGLKEPAKPAPAGGTQATPEGGGSSKGAAPAAKEVAFKGKAEDILKEFEADKKAAGDKYQGKFVEAEALVLNAPTDANGLSLAVEAKRDAPVVVCDLTPEAVKKVRELGKGQKVKAIGKLQGGQILGAIYLFECDFTEAGPNPAIKVAAKDLAAEFTQEDGEPAAKKYADKELFIEGVVKDMEEYVKLGTPFFSEPGLIILSEVTTETIRRAVKDLWQRGFFKHLKPLPAATVLTSHS
jgi:hypothetical protein